MDPVSRLLDRLFESTDPQYYHALQTLRSVDGYREEFPVMAIEKALRAAEEAPSHSPLQARCVSTAETIATTPNAFFNLHAELDGIAAKKQQIEQAPPAPAPEHLTILLRRAEEKFVGIDLS